ncbi:Protein YceI [Cupriavidus yeoncheonensis]|uniref:Protein YceI n=1 Tax=Cupriavidus yeoncheonensis TaxID=1462994 RepID=A0A916IXQ1_9BURK|nr:YceI family protein [Cupriavidus yeoncheonensis]CAG2152264.1 Protein YceI [Cupriavidus yeoncheonensis]
MRDSPLWAGAPRRHAIAGLLFATFASLAGFVSRAQPAEANEQADQYVLQPQRSSVTFAVDAFSHSQIRMRFHRMNAQLERAHGDPDPGRVTVTIDAASVEAHPRFLSAIIRGGGMLDVARYPEIRFVSTHLVRTGEGSGWLFGDLTIHGVTRPVRLLVTPSGAEEDPWHGGILAFTAVGEVSRREFGLSAWSSAVGDAVHMSIQVEFVHGP